MSQLVSIGWREGDIILLCIDLNSHSTEIFGKIHEQDCIYTYGTNKGRETVGGGEGKRALDRIVNKGERFNETEIINKNINNQTFLFDINTQMQFTYILHR